MSMRVAFVGVSAMAAALLAGCTSSDSTPDATRAGTQYVAIAGQLTSRISTLQTVQGRLDVRVGTLRSSVVEVGSGERIDAPDGGSFVEVELEQGPPADVPQSGKPTYPTLQAWLVADGRAYPIALDRLRGYGTGDDAADESAEGLRAGSLPFGAAYLAVAGRPRSLAIRVQQDGRTRSVDVRTGRRDAGSDGLAVDTRPVATHSCGQQRNPSRIVPDFRPCTISYARTPWLGGKGFAPAGKAWLVARIDVGVNTGVEVRGSDSLYQLDTSPRVTVAWPGGAVVPVGINEDPAYTTSSGDADVAFLVPATEAANGTLTVTANYRLGGILGAGEPASGVRIGQSVPVTWRTVIR